MSFLRVAIDHSWSIISSIRDQVRESLASFPDEVVDASVMTASELVENGIKHGVTSPDCPQVEFIFEIKDDPRQIIIQVANGTEGREENLDNFFYVIDRIMKSEDKAALYTQRLTELMESNHHGASQLGLYRIAYEGGFDLSYKLNKTKLTVIAHRSLSRGS